MKYVVLFFVLTTTLNINAQELTAQQLLDKAINVHDPNGNWESFKADLQVTMTTPNKSQRVSDIKIDLPEEFFQISTVRDSVITIQNVIKGKASVSKSDLRNLQNIVKTAVKDLERTVLMRDYYTYLYGLPMKLKDPGTHIDSKVERKTFKGKEYLILKASYDEAIGSDVWFFYFDPSTYKMEIYQFFKTNEKGDIKPDSGEYILLSDNHVVNDINIPKTRKWYYNKDDKFLGADVITK